MSEGKTGFAEFLYWLLYNLYEGEPPTDSKRVDAEKVKGLLGALFETIPPYANGLYCDDTGLSDSTNADLWVRTSKADGSTHSQGLILSGQRCIIVDSGSGTAWAKTAYADNKIRFSDSDRTFPSTAPAGLDYTTLKNNPNLGIFIFPHSMPPMIPASWLAISDEADGVNGMTVITGEQSDSPTSGAGSYFTALMKLKDALDSIVTPFDVGHDSAGAHRAGIITYANLDESALMTVRPSLVIPFWHIFPVPDNGSGTPLTVYDPPQWGAGASAPPVRNRAATGLAGGAWDFQVELGGAHADSEILYICHSAVTAGLMASCKVRFFILVKTSAAHTGKRLTITISDSATSSTATVIAGSGAGGLSTSYTLFQADHTLSAAPQYLRVELSNADGSGVTGLLIGAVDFQQVTVIKRALHRPALIPVRIPLQFAGTLLPSRYLHAGDLTTTNTAEPSIRGEIVGMRMTITEDTAPVGGVGDLFSLLVEGSAVKYLAVAAGAHIGELGYTPTSLINLYSAAGYPGARVTGYCSAVASGSAGVNAFGEIIAWVITA